MEINKLQLLMNDVRQWSDATFGYGKRTTAIVHHLKQEVVELILALNKTYELGCDESVGVGELARQIHETEIEYADCFMLLLDSAHHFGLSAENIVDLTREKLEINKKRKWGNPDENGVVEHIRGEATE